MKNFKMVRRLEKLLMKEYPKAFCIAMQFFDSKFFGGGLERSNIVRQEGLHVFHVLCMHGLNLNCEGDVVIGRKLITPLLLKICKIYRGDEPLALEEAMEIYAVLLNTPLYLDPNTDRFQKMVNYCWWAIRQVDNEKCPFPFAKNVGKLLIKAYVRILKQAGKNDWRQERYGYLIAVFECELIKLRDLCRYEHSRECLLRLLFINMIAWSPLYWHPIECYAQNGIVLQCVMNFWQFIIPRILRDNAESGSERAFLVSLLKKLVNRCERFNIIFNTIPLLPKQEEAFFQFIIGLCMKGSLTNRERRVWGNFITIISPEKQEVLRCVLAEWACNYWTVDKTRSECLMGILLELMEVDLAWMFYNHGNGFSAMSALSGIEDASPNKKSYCLWALKLLCDYYEEGYTKNANNNDNEYLLMKSVLIVLKAFKTEWFEDSNVNGCLADLLNCIDCLVSNNVYSEDVWVYIECLRELYETINEEALGSLDKRVILKIFNKIFNNCDDKDEFNYSASEFGDMLAAIKSFFRKIPGESLKSLDTDALVELRKHVESFRNTHIGQEHYEDEIAAVLTLLKKKMGIIKEEPSRKRRRIQ